MHILTKRQTTLKRIQREITDLKKEDLGSITLGPLNDDLFHWTASLPGPEGSVYEGGVFNVEILLTHDYPYAPEIPPSAVAFTLFCPQIFRPKNDFQDTVGPFRYPLTRLHSHATVEYTT